MSKENNMKVVSENINYETADTTDIPLSKIQKLKSLGLKVIRVPIRMNGISSQGTYLGCHINVKKMVHAYGGKRLVGHGLLMSECGQLTARSHSVWITPENKVACITKANYSKEELEKGYVLFIPRMVDKTGITSLDEEVFKDFVIDKGNKRIGLITPNDDMEKLVPMSLASIVLKETEPTGYFGMALVNNFLLEPSLKERIELLRLRIKMMGLIGGLFPRLYFGLFLKQTSI